MSNQTIRTLVKDGRKIVSNNWQAFSHMQTILDKFMAIYYPMMSDTPQAYQYKQVDIILQLARPSTQYTHAAFFKRQILSSKITIVVQMYYWVDSYAQWCLAHELGHWFDYSQNKYFDSVRYNLQHKTHDYYSSEIESFAEDFAGKLTGYEREVIRKDVQYSTLRSVNYPRYLNWLQAISS